MLQGLARLSYRRRRWVLATWVVLLIGLSAFAQSAGGAFNTQFELPGSDSQEAADILEEHGFGTRAGFGGQVVFQADDGVDAPPVQETMEALFADIEAEVDDASVVSPYEGPDGQRQISDDGTIAYAEINLADRDQHAYEDAGKVVRDLVDDVDGGPRIELGGDVFAEFEQSGSEAFGVLAAVIILLIAFGSLLAMGLPLLTALFGIGSGIAVVQLVNNFVEMPDFTTQAVAMIGIGVGIDYALFIVTRYRESMDQGLEPEAAVVRSLDTAGRAVLFAGTTVIISLMGLFLIGLAITRGIAIGTTLGVLLTMLASVTLLPALLGFVGRNIDKFGLPHRKRTHQPGYESIWTRWSHVVQRRPWTALLAALAVLVALTLPVFSLRLGFADAGNRAETDTTRRAYDLLSDGFGAGFNGPFLIAAETPGGDGDVGALEALSGRLNETEGVRFATPPQPNEEGTAAILQVFPTTSPQDEATTDLLHDLRDDVIPAALEGSSAEVAIGGVNAAVVDFADYNARRLPVFIGAVLVLSFLLLMVVFRSLLVPLKAVIMNLLSIGAAYGATVAVFQYGWGNELIGVGRPGPVEAWTPMMLFAVVFGLSMDYEVFLLSRIKEQYDRTGDNAVAVADGLAVTARVITAAAAIMVCVFAGFILGNDYSIKLFGFGLAIAVLLDATIVRLVLVPATMELLGDRNWWLPAWLDRLLPRVHVEAATDLDAELDELTRREEVSAR